MKRFSVLFLFLVLAIPIGAHADVLSDNIVIQQSGQNSQWNNGVMLGQSLKTDSSAYILTSVDLYMISVGGATGLLSIYTNDVSNRPGSLVGSLTSPPSFTSSYAVSTFTTSGISLNANSEYWVVLNKNTPGNGYLSWVYSSSNTGNGVGFNIDSGYGSSLSATDWTPFSHPFEMKVNANPVAKAATAYIVTGGGAFGTIDLNTGVFTQLGLTSVPVDGLALVGTTLYAAGQGTGNNRGQLYSVNPSTGALMSIGSPTGIQYTAFGSYGGTLYALDNTSSNANLYSINSSTGAATLIGPTNTGQSLAGYWALSTNSTALYFTLGSNLYALNTTTGSATLVGSMGNSDIRVGAIAEVGGVLYAGQDLPQPPLRIVTLNKSTGAATVLSNVTNSPGSNASYIYGLAPTIQTWFLFVPIVISSAGMNGSLFTSELTLTNRGTGNATINYTYTDTLDSGSGSGTATDTLLPGQQKIVPDAIDYLRTLGIPIPATGNQGGTLLVSFTGLASPLDGGVTVRTTTAVSNGRAGLAYAGVPVSMGLSGPSYLCGLRQNSADRSNVAVQNMGAASDGNITMRLTAYSGDAGNSTSQVLPDIVLAPGGFMQISGVLTSNGLALSNGYVRVERIIGTAPYYAYGVINDNANSDGSFIPPILESSLVGKTRMTLPVMVETDAFTSELALTNWSASTKTLQCSYVANAISTSNPTASFNIQLNAGEQKIIPHFVQSLRAQGVTGIGPAGPAFAGALFVSIAAGDLSGISVAARTSTPGGGGEYGLYYTAMPDGTTSTSDAWLYGLQQNSENRTNLALVNTGETDNSADTFQIDLYDGTSGAKVGTVPPQTLSAFAWTQINTLFSTYASGTTEGYAHITRTAGNNPFIAYAVINDGTAPGQRSGDGAFIASAP